MGRIVAIVEGHGEVAAVPVLLRRIAVAVRPGLVPDLPRPIRIKRQRLLKEGELERAIELAARKAGPTGRILVLLDADEDCPKEVAEEILERALRARPDRVIRAVLAKKEFESWFLAAAESLAGQRGIFTSVAAPDDPERIRGAKEWIGRHMPPGRSYRETLDQPALCAAFDLERARARSPSFAKMWRDVESMLITGGG